MKYMNCLICMLMIFAGWGCSDDTIQENKEPMVATDGGYLFAHMTDENYARLFYSVSKANRVAGLLRPSGYLPGERRCLLYDWCTA